MLYFHIARDCFREICYARPEDRNVLQELASSPKVVGLKQSMQALRTGKAKKVYLACDADPAVLARVEALCDGVEVERGATMAQLGEAGGISVGAAVLTLLD